MQTSPYSIYINKRPIRIAFFVDSNGSTEWFDRIFKFNQEKWGGRFNPIILTDGENISEQEWNFLRKYDPDIILSNIDLNEELKKKIHIFFSPYKIEIIKPDGKSIYLHDDPISIFPTKQNIVGVSHIFPFEESSIVLFEFSDSTPDVIKKFIQRNFGFLENTQLDLYYIKKNLGNCKKQIYKISDFDSLNQTLLELGDFHNRVTFPIQICSTPNTFKGVNYNAYNEYFGIIIGDSRQDLSYFWNRSMMISGWMRTALTQLWLPKEFIEESKIRPGLENFLYRHVGLTGSNNTHGAHFITFSLTEDELNKFSSSFIGKLMYHIKPTKFSEPQMPDLREEWPFYYLKQNLELFRAHSREEHIIIEEPDVPEGVMGGQSWCADIYIQGNPQKFPNIIGKEYWWQLPQRNNLIYELSILNKPARINSQKTFSVLMRRRTSISPEENVLVIKLPEEKSVFDSLICGESYAYIGTGDRERFLSRPFYFTQSSDKGMYLSGVLSLFPCLSTVHRLFEERYWRRMFEKMSNQEVTKDNKRKEDIFNKLKKNIKRGRDFNNSGEDIEWLAEMVLNLAKTHTKQEVEITYQDFKKVAENEHSQYLQNEGSREIIFDEKDLKESLSDLINWNVLLLGIKPKCPRCGYRFWYHINEAQQGIICKGCNYEFTISAEEKWYYKLNSLVWSGFSLHGTIPVLLVLGQLLFDSRSSFIYVPSLDLYQKDETEKENKYGEIDVICIIDGKFIIGEVKQSIGLFETSDFEKAAEIGMLLKPDIILFSSLDKKPNTFVINKIIELKEKLKSLEIDVQWYQIHHSVFEPQPVR
jgi:hypothetical protein